MEDQYEIGLTLSKIAQIYSKGEYEQALSQKELDLVIL